jgi:hypothetical protein
METDFDFATLSNAMLPFQEERERVHKWKNSHRLITAYQKEFKEYAQEISEIITNEQVVYFFDRLKARYKFRQTLVIYKMRRHSGNCSRYEIRLSPPTNISTLGHEVAHAIHMKTRKFGRKERWHNKRFLNIERRVIKVINTNKADWNAALLKKATDKAASHAKQAQRMAENEAKQATPSFKLQKLNEQRKRWMSKKKRAETAIKKIDRRIKIWSKKEAV